MNSRQVLETLVDEMIQKGIIQADQKASQISALAADDRAAEYWANNFLRQQDYTKKTMSLAEERKQLESERQARMSEVEQERRKLADWEQQTRAEVERLRQLENTSFAQSTRLAQMEQVLKDYGLADQLTDLPTTPATPSPSPVAPTQEPKMDKSTDPNFVSRDEAAQAMQEILRLQSRAMLINNRHQQLFGQPLTDDIISEALQANVDIESYWKTKYGVETREATLREEQARQEREKMKEELRRELMSEYAADPSRVIGGTPVTSNSPGHILERYAASRAAVPVPAEGQPAVAPERQPEIALHQNRIGEAITYFRQNFTPDGSPLSGDSRRT